VRQFDVTEERGTMHLEKPLWRDEKTARLLEAMLTGEVGEIKPVIDPDREMGYHYPELNRVLDIPDKEAQEILDSLAGQTILEKAFVEKYIHCPQCQSLNLAPGYYCVKCSSGKLARGRVLVHSVCEYAGAEEEFNQAGRLVCPKCFQEVKVIGQDYTSLGVMRKCRDCNEIFAHPSIKWRCLKCGSVTPEDKVVEVDAHSYGLPEREELRLWLRFELGHKPKLIKFLQERGFEVTENATVTGRSGPSTSSICWPSGMTAWQSTASPWASRTPSRSWVSTGCSASMTRPMTVAFMTRSWWSSPR